MSSSWKIGAVSGLMAGIVLGVFVEFFNQITVSVGLFETWWRPISTNNLHINIVLGIIFGVILGIIYSKVYNLIPRRGIVNGLIYGLIIYFLNTVRIEFFNIAYGRYLALLGSYFSGIFVWLSFGIVLGIVYDKLKYGGKYPVKEETKIITYDMKSGLLPGAIAGAIGGIAAAITVVYGTSTGLYPLPDAPKTFTIDFFLNQAATHVFINMIWGAVFGAIFAKIYNLVPGKGVLKGLCHGLIMYLITSFQIGVWWTAWAVYHGSQLLTATMVYGLFVVGSVNMVVFGLVLGLLYRKPETPAIKKEKIRTVEMVNCIHCGASIPKGSKHCNECGKKQAPIKTE
jgi:hypothetical protein